MLIHVSMALSLRQGHTGVAQGKQFGVELYRQLSKQNKHARFSYVSHDLDLENIYMA